MHSPKHDEKGLVGVILTIDTTVQNITGSVQGANSHLNTGCTGSTTQCSDALPVLSQTETLASQINDAAKPLTGEAAQILTSVNSINGTASQILANATSINGTVHSINGLAGSINSSVQSINSSLSGVNGDVAGIKDQIVIINQNAQTITDIVVAIKGDTGNINATAAAIDTQAKGICADNLKLVGVPLPGLGLLPIGQVC